MLAIHNNNIIITCVPIPSSVKSLHFIIFTLDLFSVLYWWTFVGFSLLQYFSSLRFIPSMELLNRKRGTSSVSLNISKLFSEEVVPIYTPTPVTVPLPIQCLKLPDFIIWLNLMYMEIYFIVLIFLFICLLAIWISSVNCQFISVAYF